MVNMIFNLVIKIMMTEAVYFHCKLIVSIDRSSSTRPNTTKKSQVSLNGHWLCFFVLNKSPLYLYQAFSSPTICSPSLEMKTIFLKLDMFKIFWNILSYCSLLDLNTNISETQTNARR